MLEVRDGSPVSEVAVRYGVPSRATVHRVLVRNGLIRVQGQEQERTYKRWQREALMQLWQMDLVGGVFLADGRECELVTGIDDHCRFVVIVTVVVIPTGRAVVELFTAVMRRMVSRWKC